MKQLWSRLAGLDGGNREYHAAIVTKKGKTQIGSRGAGCPTGVGVDGIPLLEAPGTSASRSDGKQYQGDREQG